LACLPRAEAQPYTQLDVIRYRTIAEPHHIRTAYAGLVPTYKVRRDFSARLWRLQG
jgi:hypothetical protein